VQIVPQLQEVVVEMTDFKGDYGEDWRRVKEEEVGGINWTADDDLEMAMATVHLVVSDRSVREIGRYAFIGSMNLVKVTAPFVEEVGEGTFEAACNLRLVTFSPDAVFKPGANLWSLSLSKSLRFL